jgi:hypothetical protein
MGLFNDYRDSRVYGFIEKVANFCSNLVFEIVDWIKRQG